MKLKGIAGIALTVFVATAFTMVFFASSEPAEGSVPVGQFPQAGKFYTFVGRGFTWTIAGGEKTVTHEDSMVKVSVQDFDGAIAHVNYTVMRTSISPENGWFFTMIFDIDSEVAIDRSILSSYHRGMGFELAEFLGGGGRSADEDVGEHAWYWFPTSLNVGDAVPVGFESHSHFLGDNLYTVVGEETILVLGEKQDSWKLHMGPLIADGVVFGGKRVISRTFWVDKDTGISLKALYKEWDLDGSYGSESEHVLVHSNIALGPESTKALSPTYTLTIPSSPGFPEAGKFYTWYWLYNTSANNYEEGLRMRWVVDVTDDKALLYGVDITEQYPEGKGVGELEDVRFTFYNFTIGTTSRGYLSATAFMYHINMTSLNYWKEDLPGVKGRIGHETYYWAPTNLYIGANVLPRWTVVDEEFFNIVGEWQETWVVSVPPDPPEANVVIYFDKDVGIPVAQAGNIFSIWVMDTNIGLGPEAKPSIRLTGEFDYIFKEKLKIRLTALVRDANTMKPISGLDVTMGIYRPDGSLWQSARMVERLPGTGIYEWQSTDTLWLLGLPKGVYLVHVKASFLGGHTASDILEFHIDPPAEDPVALVTLIAIVASIVAGSLLIQKLVNNLPLRLGKHENTRT